MKNLYIFCLILGFETSLCLSTTVQVQYNTINAGLTGTEIREIRDGKVAGFRYENSFLGTRNYEQGFISNLTTRASSVYTYVDPVKGTASSTQIYAISTTDNNRYGGIAYFGEFLPVRVYGFVKNANGSSSIVEPPGVSNSSIEGIYGDTSVGWFEQSGKRYGFYKIETGANVGYYSVMFNNASQGLGSASATELRGIWGGFAVGTATYGNTNYGFGFNGSEFSQLYTAPNSTSTYFNDYNDGIIAGTATIGGANKPFLFNPVTSEWEFFTSPEGYSATGSSYDNGILVGSYLTSSGQKLGYYANVPEPNTSSLLLLSLCLQVILNRSQMARRER
jgi:hypothetical protein